MIAARKNERNAAAMDEFVVKLNKTAFQVRGRLMENVN